MISLGKLGFVHLHIAAKLLAEVETFTIERAGNSPGCLLVLDVLTRERDVLAAEIKRQKDEIVRRMRLRQRVREADDGASS